MPDREKIVHQLEQTASFMQKFGFGGFENIQDAIAMLKEQEPVKVQYTAMGGLRYGACPQCDARIDNLVNPKACGFCGQAVKWE